MRSPFRLFSTQAILTIIFLSMGFALPASTQQAQQPTAMELSKKESVPPLSCAARRSRNTKCAPPPRPCRKSCTATALQKEIQGSEAGIRTRRNAHLCRTGQACGLREFGFASELNGDKPPEGCDKGGPDPAQNKTRTADLSSQLVCGGPQIVHCDQREESIRSDRRSLRRAETRAWAWRSWLSGTTPTTTVRWSLLASERNRAASKPAESAAGQGHVLNGPGKVIIPRELSWDRNRA